MLAALEGFDFGQASTVALGAGELGTQKGPH